MELSASSSSEHKEHITIITLAPLRLNKGTKSDTRTLELCKFTLHSDISYPHDQFSRVSMSSTSDDSRRWSQMADLTICHDAWFMAFGKSLFSQTQVWICWGTSALWQRWTAAQKKQDKLWSSLLTYLIRFQFLRYKCHLLISRACLKFQTDALQIRTYWVI